MAQGDTNTNGNGKLVVVPAISFSKKYAERKLKDFGEFPYGVNNIQPNRLEYAINLSPTAKGCISIQTEVFSQDKTSLPEYNGVIKKIANDLAKHKGYCVLVSFNKLGKKVFSSAPLKNVRIEKDYYVYKKIQYSGRSGKGSADNILSFGSVSYYQEYFLAYNEKNAEYVKKQIMESNPIAIDGVKYTSANDGKTSPRVSEWMLDYVMYSDDDIYPVSDYECVLPSMMFEGEVQQYSLTGVMNGFTIAGFLVVPQGYDPTSSESKRKLERMTGARNVGNVMIIEGVTDAEGNVKASMQFQPAVPTNLDSFYTHQIENAKTFIFAVAQMPPDLVGSNRAGIFNKQNYEEAYQNYLLRGKEKSDFIIENLKRVINDGL